MSGEPRWPEPRGSRACKVSTECGLHIPGQMQRTRGVEMNASFLRERLESAVKACSAAHGRRCVDGETNLAFKITLEDWICEVLQNPKMRHTQRSLKYIKFC